MLRQVASRVGPGGAVVFHEFDWDGVRSFPPVPTYDTCCDLIRETLRRSETETQMGGKLCSTFAAAGLPTPSMRLEAVVGGGANASDPLRLIADLAESLSDTMEKYGVTAAAELDANALFERMRAEAEAEGSIVVGLFQFGAWSRV